MNRSILQKTVSSAALAAALVFAGPARADSTQTRAQAIFDEAIALMKADKAAEACPKFEESQRLDPGMGTEFRLAECYEKVGRKASAHTLFLKVADEARAAKNTEREDFAKKRAEALALSLAKLTISVPAEASSLVGFTITLDGAVVDPGSWGTAVPIDPGRHVVEATAVGKDPWSTKVDVEDKPDTITCDVPSHFTDVGRGKWTTERKVALGLAGGGALGVILGSVFGIVTFAKTGAAKCSVEKPPVCDAEGVKLQHEANTTANVSNVAFAIGGAALVSGVVLFFVAPGKRPIFSRLSASPSAGAGKAGLFLRGEW